MACDLAPLRPGGGRGILPNTVDPVLRKKPNVSVGQKVNFYKIEVQNMLQPLVFQSEGFKIRKACFGTNRCVFWNLDTDGITGKLVGKSFDGRQLNAQP